MICRFNYEAMQILRGISTIVSNDADRMDESAGSKVSDKAYQQLPDECKQAWHGR